MQAINEQDEYRLAIEPDGEVCMAVATDGAEMCHQLLMAIGISTLFGGGLVHLDGWLPGLILKVQALRSVENGDLRLPSRTSGQTCTPGCVHGLRLLRTPMPWICPLTVLIAYWSPTCLPGTNCPMHSH